jgi:hypothetical protein
MDRGEALPPRLGGVTMLEEVKYDEVRRGDEDAHGC